MISFITTSAGLPNSLLEDAISGFQGDTVTSAMRKKISLKTVSPVPVKSASDIAPVSAPEPQIPQDSESFEDICHALQKSLADELYMNSEEIDNETEFVTIGLDSIIAVTWIRKINTLYGLSLKATEIYSYPTINDLAKFMLKQGKKRGYFKPVSKPPVLSDVRQNISETAKQDVSKKVTSATRKKITLETVSPVKSATDTAPVHDSEPEVPQHHESLEDVCHELRESLADELYMNSEEIDNETEFVTIGLDSIIAVTWIRKINTLYGLSLKATEIYSYPTINDLAKFMLKQGKKRGYFKPVSKPPVPSDASQPNISETPKLDISPVENFSGKNLKSSEKNHGRICESQKEPGEPAAIIRTSHHKTDNRPSFPGEEKEPVAVIGMSGRFPKAKNVSEYWNNIIKKRDCISEIPEARWNISRHYDPNPDISGRTYSKWMGVLEDIYLFDPAFFNISPRDAEVMEPQHRLFLQTGWHCIENAGYAPSSLWGNRCGVFLGCGSGNYGPTDGISQNILGTDSSLLPARLSYFLNLKGPCLAINTACSSSLVALAYACDSLVCRDSDTAIAGGVFIITGPGIHIGMSRLRALSPQGRCFAFDKRANGFVPGEGVGAVFLKRLSDARKDGDTIYGVIKGWGVNQDGKTNGITAPNPESQAQLEQWIYTKYSVNPEDIQLIEAHGTGTKLGDPMEFDALCKSFRHFTEKEGYCALGSVKSNIGHLAPASGIAGLIKILLALKHRKLPPTANFDTLNDQIQLKGSPFYISTECRDWVVPHEKPRCAAVSSFGYSGTNAHIVIEEYLEKAATPQTARASEVTGPQIIVLSAKSAENLNDYAKEIAAFLTGNADDPLNLSDVAYTLQVGREAMEARMAVTVHTMEELKEKLAGFIEGRRDIKGLYQGQPGKDNKDIMAVFAADKDMAKTIEAWIAKGKYSRLSDFWVRGLSFDWNKLYGDIKPRRISLPTYPFSEEPYRMPEIAGTEPGNRGFTVANLHPLIGRNTSTLHEQRFTTTLTGNEFYLADHVVGGKKVLPGVAYIEMARAAGELAAAQGVYKIRNIVWAQPVRLEDTSLDIHVSLYPDNGQISYEVSVSENDDRIVCSQGKLELGSMSAPESANRPADISAIKKRCGTIEDKDALYLSFKEKGLRLGPGFQVIEELVYNETEALSLLKLPGHLSDTARTSDGNRGFVLHPSLMDGALQTTAALRENRQNTKTLFLPFSLGEVTVLRPLPATCHAYATIAKAGKIPVYDIQILDTSGNLLVQIKDLTSLPTGRTTEMTIDAVRPEPLYFEPVWKHEAPGNAEQDTPGSVMIVDTDEALYSTAECMDNKILWVRPVRTKHEYTETAADESDIYLIDAENPKDYQTLIQTLSHKNILPDCIIYNGQPHAGDTADNSQIPRTMSDLPFHRLLYLTQALMSLNPVSPIRLIYVHESASPRDAAVSGFARTARSEFSKFIYKTLELEDMSDPKAVFGKVVREFGSEDSAVEIRYRGEDRQVKYLREIDLNAEITAEDLPLKKNCVYLITGGMGGLGRIFAEYLAKQYGAKLVLTGRSVLSPETVSPGWRLLSDQEMDILGSEALYVRADISVKEDVQKLVSIAKSRFDRIDGIIHAAGMLRDAFIAKKTGKEADEVIAPKVLGSYYLDQATKDEPLDFFALFSSTAGVMGSPGQCDYAYANSFMDYFAGTREALKKAGKRSGRTLSFNWPLWKEGGMQIDRQAEQLGMKTKGNYPMPSEAGISAYEKGLAASADHLIIFHGNAQKIRERILKAESVPRETHRDQPENLRADKNELFPMVQNIISGIVSEILKLDPEKIDPHKDMSEYGFDSISLTEVINNLKVSRKFNFNL